MSTPGGVAASDSVELARRLDEAAIVELAVLYAWALDEGDREALARVFASDATALLGRKPLLEGFDAIADRVEQALGGLDASHHMVSNHQVQVDGDTAQHRCYLQAQHVRVVDGVQRLYMVAGTYTDRVERRSEGWRIVHRELTVIWTDGDERALRP